jgi:hypothetical protein
MDRVKSTLVSIDCGGDIKMLGPHMNITNNTTPQDFIKHFLRMYDSSGNPYQIVYNAHILQVKVF